MASGERALGALQRAAGKGLGILLIANQDQPAPWSVES
jgi:hypothetical protein